MLECTCRMYIGYIRRTLIRYELLLHNFYSTFYVWISYICNDVHSTVKSQLCHEWLIEIHSQQNTQGRRQFWKERKYRLASRRRTAASRRVCWSRRSSRPRRSGRHRPGRPPTRGTPRCNPPHSQVSHPPCPWVLSCVSVLEEPVNKHLTYSMKYLTLPVKNLRQKNTKKKKITN